MNLSVLCELCGESLGVAFPQELPSYGSILLKMFGVCVGLYVRAGKRLGDESSASEDGFRRLFLDRVQRGHFLAARQQTTHLADALGGADDQEDVAGLQGFVG